MKTKLVIGLDGHDSGDRALAYATDLAKLIGECELLIVYVIEWSPYTFQTAEENEERHKRREEEIAKATTRVVEPAVKKISEAGLKVRGMVRHGDVSKTLNAVSVEEKANQIIVSRSSESGLAQRVFGSSTAKLVMSASVPVTVVG